MYRVKTLSATRIEDLQEQIEDYLNKGWVTLGDITKTKLTQYSPFVYVQTVERGF